MTARRRIATLPIQEIDMLIPLEKKLRRNKTPILNDGEVDLLASGVRAVLGTVFAQIPRHITVRLDDIVRWVSLRARCEQARAQQGWPSYVSGPGG